MKKANGTFESTRVRIDKDTATEAEAIASFKKLEGELAAKKADKVEYYKERGLTPDKINPAFLTPELCALAGSNQLVATRLAEITAMAMEAKQSQEDPTIEAANLKVPEGDVEMSEAEVFEQMEGEFAIAAVEAAQAWGVANPGKPVDINEVFKMVVGPAKTKERASKVKNGAKPASKMVGGASSLAAPVRKC